MFYPAHAEIGGHLVNVRWKRVTKQESAEEGTPLCQIPPHMPGVEDFLSETRAVKRAG